MSTVGIRLGVAGLVFFSWGASLIHHNYVVQRVVTYMWKAGESEISSEVAASHSVQAAKDLAAHLLFIALGVSLVVVAITKVSKTHNQSLKAGAPKSGAP